jgi:hypothetical protein
MTDESEARRKSRLRWVTLGEAIAIAALILSGLGLWREWNKREDSKVVVEQPNTVPLALRGRVTDDGKRLEISAIEDSHALQALTIAAAGKSVETGSSGRLDAEDVEELLGNAGDSNGRHRLPVRITARYVEAGADKTATGSYVVTYRWEGGGLFGGRHIRIEDFSR